MAASRDLSLPQRRRCHTKGTPHYIQSRCSGRPGTGRAAADVSPCSGSFPRHIFQVLRMAEEHGGRRREGWSQACQTRRQGDSVYTASASPAYRGRAPRCASGHHARTFSAHIAFDEHAKIRRCPGRHTALVKDPAVLRGHEVRLWLWPCSGQKRGHRRRQCSHPMEAAPPCFGLCSRAQLHRFPLFLRRSLAHPCSHT
jgi:hypothetical protein